MISEIKVERYQTCYEVKVWCDNFSEVKVLTELIQKLRILENIEWENK